MNKKAIIGVVVAIVVAAVVYFVFLKDNRCSESAVTELMPKIQAAVTDAVAKDPTKAEELTNMANEMMTKVTEAAANNDISAACDVLYEFADKLGVK